MMMGTTMGVMAAIRLAITAMAMRTGTLIATTITVSAQWSLSLDTLAMENLQICSKCQCPALSGAFLHPVHLKPAADGGQLAQIILQRPAFPGADACGRVAPSGNLQQLSRSIRGLHSLGLMHVADLFIQAATAVAAITTAQPTTITTITTTIITTATPAAATATPAAVTAAPAAATATATQAARITTTAIARTTEVGLHLALELEVAAAKCSNSRIRV